MIKKSIGKYSTFIILILTLLTQLTACSNEETPVIPEITPSTEELNFSNTGGNEVLNIRANIPLDVKSNEESWCRVAPVSSSSTSVLRYIVTVDANSNPVERRATISLKGGSLSKTVEVVQIAADGLEVSPLNLNDVSGEGAQIEVSITTNGAPTMTIHDDWITETVTRTMTEQKIIFNVGANYGMPRSGSITFSLGSITKTVTIHQLTASLPNTGMESNALQLASKICAGWNIGNTLEAIGGETAWGNPQLTEEYIKKIKSLGFNAIRIPCAWDQYIEDASTFKIRESWLNRVDEVVGYCVANGMYAIVNIHWDGGWLENNVTPDKQEENNKKQNALWTQIATRLNHYDEHLLFAGTNEPNVDNAQKMTVLKTYLQTFIDAVRATGGNNAVRNLIVQGPNTDIEMTHRLFGEMPTDIVPNRLMAEVHYYNPWTFCGLEKDESWGKMAYFWGPYTVSGSDRNSLSGNEVEMKSLFSMMKTMFVDKGIPIILGEYGAITHRTGLGAHQDSHNQSRRIYDETVTREAKNHGMVPFYWETGRVVSRLTGEVKDNYSMDGIVKGAKEGKYPFSLTP